MQIRLGNRQDDAAVKTLVTEVMSEFKLAINHDGSESDLKNIEANYFARDGVFLVAEHEGKLVGIAGARRNGEAVLELVRIAVSKDFRGKGAARSLLSTVLSFARDLGYERIIVEPARQYPGGSDFLAGFGFTSDPAEDAQVPWYYQVER